MKNAIETTVEGLAAMQELSFAFFEERGNEAEIRRQFLRSPVCLPLDRPKT